MYTDFTGNTNMDVSIPNQKAVNITHIVDVKELAL